MARHLLALMVVAGCWASAAQATSFNYAAVLSGSAENPAVVSPGTGSSLVTYNSIDQTLLVNVIFSGLLGETTAAHIHCCVDAPGNVGVATPVPNFPGFPLGVMAGIYSQLFDLTDIASFNPAFFNNNGGTTTSATNALVAGLDAGRAYLNIHSNAYPSGEIRGFLSPVPEPGTLLLLGLGIGAVRLGRWRRG